MQGMIIGIVHHKTTKQFLPALLESLKGVKYPVRIVYNDKDDSDEKFPFRVLYNPVGGYELGALRKLMMSCPAEDDFFLIHASTVIKDQGIFDIAAQFDGSLAMSPGFASFMGKYRRKILREIGIPVPQTRKVAIYYEYFWNIVYMNTEPKMAMADSPLNESEVFETKFGRKNMLLESAYMKKWKSNWEGFKILQDYIPK